MLKRNRRVELKLPDVLYYLPQKRRPRKSQCLGCGNFWPQWARKFWNHS